MHDLDRSDLVFEVDGIPEDTELDEEAAADPDRAFDEIEESELATQLLATAGDRELDQFLDNVIHRFRRIRPGVAKKMGGYLKGAVKKSLPAIAGMAGAAVGGPAGAVIASQGAPYVGNALGLELEGLSAEDAELETAKQLVRLAGAAISNAANAAADAPAESVARQAVIDAARRFAPGLVRPAGAAKPQQGTWYREGNRIVIVGV